LCQGETAANAGEDAMKPSTIRRELLSEHARIRGRIDEVRLAALQMDGRERRIELRAATAYRSAGDVGASVRRLDHARRQSQSFGLTHRELEIVRAVVNGDTNREIAARLSISQNTVKRHLMHIFNKIGASNRVELALFAAHHRLLEGI